MKAILCEELGPPERLTLVELPDPEPGPGEVVVDVTFAALNFFDSLIIEGRYQTKPSLPFSPGGPFTVRYSCGRCSFHRPARTAWSSSPA